MKKESLKMAEKPQHLSVPAETYFSQTQDQCSASVPLEFIIVGSGYGAAMAALALSERFDGEEIVVLERGREVVPGEFPQSLGALPGEATYTMEGKTKGFASGLWDVRVGHGITAVVGRGVGGGSLINASVAYAPPEGLIKNWPRLPGKSPEEWWKRFQESQKEVARVLGVEAHPHATGFSKYEALEQLGNQLGEGCTTKAAPLTVRFVEGKNQVGVEQRACNDCGNCVSGCNTGAKGSLDNNVWPLLRSRGVQIVSGATVRSVKKKEGSGFVLEVCLTHDRRRSFTLAASRVVLSAGTFGSTEILLRSRELSLSGRLGEGFNGNGDLLGWGEGRVQSVESVARRPSTLGVRDKALVGPTIVGICEVPAQSRNPKEADSGGSRHRPAFLLEDGAVPFAVRRLLEEVIVTQNAIKRLASGELPPWFDAKGKRDPAAGSLDAIHHHPIHLVMGRDGTTGRLELQNDGIVAHWPHPDAPVPETNFFAEVGRCLEDAGRKLVGRKPFPSSQEAPIAELDALDQHSITVHPLGGCAMAERAEDGVVNPGGEVFCGKSGSDTHRGLYVLDGSILPEAPGVNPFLTIATLSHCLAREIASFIPKPVSPARSTVSEAFSSRPEPETGSEIRDPLDEVVKVELNERLFLELSDQSRLQLQDVFDHNEGGDAAARETQLGVAQALVCDVTITCEDVFEWLKEPGRAFAARFCLSTTDQEFGDTVPTTMLRPLDNFNGEVHLAHLDAVAARPFLRVLRRLQVLLTFGRLRGGEVFRGLMESLGDRIAKRPQSDSDGGFWSKIVEKARALWALSGVQADRRAMIYRFGRGSLSFIGRKELSYQGVEPDPLKTLRELPFRLKSSGGALRDTMRVDIIRFTGEPSVFQVQQTPDSLHSILALLAAGALVGRGVLSSMFWSFRRPSYRRFADKDAENTPRLVRPPALFQYLHDGETRSSRMDHEISAKVGQGPTSRTIRLIHYSPDSKEQSKKSVLLIHGLAHGSRVFWTDTIERPLLGHLLAEGYDVWLLDHSLSVNLARNPHQSITMDDIAAEDIPWAVRTVFERSNANLSTPRGIHVFAHCIGAGCFAMSVLSGRLRNPGGVPLIAGLVNHAVTPWMIASEDNRWRANALSLYKDQLTMGYFDPIPSNEPTKPESLYDALAGSFSWGKDACLHEKQERGDQFSRTVCNRMTLFYGKEWVHSNLDARTHAQIASLVGPGSLEILRQANFCVVRGRLTNRDGRSPYIREENIRAYWDFPTLFLHGEENSVFHPEASRRSAAELSKYVSENVSARMVPGYGHMDLLFGKRAFEDVYPHIVKAIEGQTSKDPRARPHEFSAPASVVVPLCGPIISHPRLVNGKLQLRLWAAANTLATPTQSVLTLAELPGQTIAKKFARSREGDGTSPDVPADPLETAEFWLGDVEVGPEGPLPCKESQEGRLVPTQGGPFAERRYSAMQWSELPWFRRAFYKGEPARLSFLVSSCLHPGAGSEQTLSDQVFLMMRGHVTERVEQGERLRGVDHVLLLGDLIYADATGEAFDPHSPFERFKTRYRRAFGGPLSSIGRHAHWLFSHVPTYFSIDDHEVQNNWARGISDGFRDDFKAMGTKTIDQDCCDKGPVTLNEDEVAALDEAFNFLVHVPDAGARFWHSFESAGVPFFVFDTRTERIYGERSGEIDFLMNEAQRKGFKDWLDEQVNDSKQPLFLASGSALAPVSKEVLRDPAVVGREDSLLAYPGFLSFLHDCLVDLKNPIVWLAGDLHINLVSRVTIERNERKIQLTQVTASGLFTPLPFINPSALAFDVRESTCQLGDLRVTASHKLLSSGTQASFVRVDFDPSTMKMVVASYAADRRSAFPQAACVTSEVIDLLSEPQVSTASKENANECA